MVILKEMVGQKSCSVSLNHVFAINSHALTGTTKHKSCREARSCVSTGYPPVCIPRIAYKNSHQNRWG